MFDGIDDGIEVKDNSDYSKGITLEIYFTLKGKGSSNIAQILMMKRTKASNGFFLYLNYENSEKATLTIDIGGSGWGIQDEEGNWIMNNRFTTNTNIEENNMYYITYTYNPEIKNDNGVLYINGVKTQTTNLGNIQNLINTPENTPIQIGSDIYETYRPENDTENRKYSFYGEIYASRVYNRPLTESEVKYNYEMTVNNIN